MCKGVASSCVMIPDKNGLWMRTDSVTEVHNWFIRTKHFAFQSVNHLLRPFFDVILVLKEDFKGLMDLLKSTTFFSFCFEYNTVQLYCAKLLFIV